MANAIQKTITIKWAGKPHLIQVSNELCNSLESNGINLFQMYLDNMRGGTPKMFVVSNLLSLILNFGAGEVVEQDEILQALTRDLDVSKFLRGFTDDFLSMVFPVPDEDESAGKPEAETPQK